MRTVSIFPTQMPVRGDGRTPAPGREINARPVGRNCIGSASDGNVPTRLFLIDLKVPRGEQISARGGQTGISRIACVSPASRFSFAFTP